MSRADSFSAWSGERTAEDQQAAVHDEPGRFPPEGVAALAGAGEILVSRTIRDLVAGSPVRLESRGTHELKGVPGAWEIFAAVS